MDALSGSHHPGADNCLVRRKRLLGLLATGRGPPPAVLSLRLPRSGAHCQLADSYSRRCQLSRHSLRRARRGCQLPRGPRRAAGAARKGADWLARRSGSSGACRLCLRSKQSSGRSPNPKLSQSPSSSCRCGSCWSPEGLSSGVSSLCLSASDTSIRTASTTGSLSATCHRFDSTTRPDVFEAGSALSRRPCRCRLLDLACFVFLVIGSPNLAPGPLAAPPRRSASVRPLAAPSNAGFLDWIQAPLNFVQTATPFASRPPWCRFAYWHCPSTSLFGLASGFPPASRPRYRYNTTHGDRFCRDRQAPPLDRVDAPTTRHDTTRPPLRCLFFATDTPTASATAHRRDAGHQPRLFALSPLVIV